MTHDDRRSRPNHFEFFDPFRSGRADIIVVKIKRDTRRVGNQPEPMCRTLLMHVVVDNAARISLRSEVPFTVHPARDRNFQ
jgi:hypothetical protein